MNESGDFEFTPGDEPEDAEAEHNPEGRPATLSVIPTSSTDPSRPRTVAAGYDRRTRTLTVIFRDGTPWNYYDVTPKEWQNFRAAISKGVFIRLYLDSHAYGEPAIDSALYDGVIQYAVGLQRIQKGMQVGQTKSARRLRALRAAEASKPSIRARNPLPKDILGRTPLEKALGYKPGNLGGTGRTRRQSADLDAAVEQFYRNR